MLGQPVIDALPLARVVEIVVVQRVDVEVRAPVVARGSRHRREFEDLERTRLGIGKGRAELLAAHQRAAGPLVFPDLLLVVERPEGRDDLQFVAIGPGVFGHAYEGVDRVLVAPDAAAAEKPVGNAREHRVARRVDVADQVFQRDMGCGGLRRFFRSGGRGRRINCGAVCRRLCRNEFPGSRRGGLRRGRRYDISRGGVRILSGAGAARGKQGREGSRRKRAADVHAGLRCPTGDQISFAGDVHGSWRRVSNWLQHGNEPMRGCRSGSCANLSS